MDQWYYAQAGQQLGPVPTATLQQKIASGELRGGDMVWKDGMGDWQPIQNVPELSSSIGYAAAPPQQYQQPYQQPYQQNPQGQMPLGYHTPIPPARGVNAGDEAMNAGEWVLAILCSGIGCIVGIVYLAQGKKKGGMMLGISILFIIIWNLVSLGIRR